MPIKEYFKVEIPEGYRIFEKAFEVAGIQYRKSDFLKVLKKGALVKFDLQAEPNNPKDSNAIQVRGSRKGFWGSVDRTIGYIPASLASHIADKGLLQHLRVRPKRMYISDNGFIEFTVDLLGPKESYERFKNI